MRWSWRSESVVSVEGCERGVFLIPDPGRFHVGVVIFFGAVVREDLVILAVLFHSTSAESSRNVFRSVCRIAQGPEFGAAHSFRHRKGVAAEH